MGRKTEPLSLIAAQGFEQRSVGVIEALAKTRVIVQDVVIGEHPRQEDANRRYADRFDNAARAVCTKPSLKLPLDYDGAWVRQALEQCDGERVVLDITGIGTRGLFGSLDAAASTGRQITLAYSEAREYWPKRVDWEALNAELSAPIGLSELVDSKPWLFGYEHTVELVAGHEGYDSAGSARALVGFLPFKCARLAAVLSAEDYTEFLFIAGCPRLPENHWRLEALRRINEEIVKQWRVEEMSTFGYRNALKELADLLLVENSFLERYDVHIALMGSKLQDVACWVFSNIVRSVTVVVSVPSRYYPEAFSEGTGAQWAFDLTPLPY